GAKNETWAGVAYALCRGKRGLKKGTPLARLLRRERGVFCRRAALTEAIILQLAEAHQRRTGSWPNPYGGAIPDAPGETWTAINAALKLGRRGLPRGSSLDKLLAKHGVQRKRRFTPERRCGIRRMKNPALQSGTRGPDHATSVGSSSISPAS